MSIDDTPRACIRHETQLSGDAKRCLVRPRRAVERHTACRPDRHAPRRSHARSETPAPIRFGCLQTCFRGGVRPARAETHAHGKPAIEDRQYRPAPGSNLPGKPTSKVALEQRLARNHDDIVGYRGHVGKRERDAPGNPLRRSNSTCKCIEIALRMHRRVVKVDSWRLVSRKLVEFMSQLRWDVLPNGPCARAQASDKREERPAIAIWFTRRRNAAVSIQHKTRLQMKLRRVHVVRRCQRLVWSRLSVQRLLAPSASSG